MNNKIIKICETIEQELLMQLGIHHEVYGCLRAKAEYLEMLISKAAMSVGLKSDWNADFNHKVGIDQSINGIRVSNKSGTFLPEKKRNHKTKNTVKITGSRTSKFRTIEDKIKHVSQKDYDCTICCATNNAEWEDGQRKYYFIALPHIDYSKLKWIENGDQKWKTCEEYNKDIVAWIGPPSVSGQLYTRVHKDLFLYFKEINLNFFKESS